VGSNGGALSAIREVPIVSNPARAVHSRFRDAREAKMHIKSRYRVLLAVVVLLVAARIALTPLAKHYTQKGLDSMEGYSGRFSDVSISLFQLQYGIEKLQIFDEPKEEDEAPLLYAENIKAGLSWKDLVKFRLAGAARIEKMKATIPLTRRIKEKAEEVAEKVEEKVEEKAGVREVTPMNLDETLERLFPFKLSRVEVKDSEVLLVDTTESRRPRLWIHDMQATLENFYTRRELADDKPMTVAVRGVVQHSGDLSFFLATDPLAEGLSFSGQLALKGFKLREAYEFMVTKTGMKFPQGQLDLMASFKCRNARITGAVKPILSRVEVRPAEDDWKTKLKAALADKTLDVFSDDVPGRDAVATVLPIKGRVENPNAQIWPTVLALVRNAFVEGLSAGFQNLPPPTAEKKEGPFKQARRTLSKGSTPPVKAQPEKK
jgi:hypothetical protein